MLQLTLIFLGGGLGSVLRFGVGRGAARMGETLRPEHVLNLYPIATLGVNTIGSLCIGAAWALVHARSEAPWWSLPLIVGVLGGFTTFSAFGFETFEMIQERRVGAALAYAATSVLLSVAAVWVGYSVVARMMQNPSMIDGAPS